MANVRIYRLDFEKHLPLNEETIRKISLFGTSAHMDNEVVEIEVMPNRPDLLSLQGFMRSFKAFLGKKDSIGLKKYAIKKPEENYRVIIDQSVKDVRPFTVCAIVKDLKFDEIKIKEIIDIQEKLHSTLGRNRKKAAIGIYPLEKITLPIRYEARAPEEIKFIPLESDRELTGLQILQKHPTGREYANLLEDQKKFPIFIDKSNKILSMPPIINSHETGKITKTTTSVFIECSGFDLNTLKKTLNIIVTTLADMGGSIHALELDYPKSILKENKFISPDLSPEIMKISLENINKTLGINLKESDLAKILPKMGCEYEKGKIKIPSYRSDILHEVDIIEDIAIAYGYENFIPEIPKIATVASESKESRIKRKIAEILTGLGLIEVSSYHLIKNDEAKLFKIEKPIELENSKTEYKYLRPNLLIPALRIFAENKDNEYPQKIFELGVVFSAPSEKDKTETGIKESDSLIIALSPGNFTEIKQILDYLSRSLSINFGLKESNHKSLIGGRTGSITINNKEIGYIGEVHPETLQDWNIKMPISLIEITLEEIYNLI